MKLHSKPVYDEKSRKAKVKTFNGVVNTVFSNDKIPKESIHYILYCSKKYRFCHENI